jgi:hypothetical protein
MDYNETQKVLEEIIERFKSKIKVNKEASLNQRGQTPLKRKLRRQEKALCFFAGKLSMLKEMQECNTWQKEMLEEIMEASNE